jgi:hypothetical protein
LWIELRGIMKEPKKGSRGPARKPGYRQELRITPPVEKLFDFIKQKYDFKHNSEALNKIAQIFLSDTEEDFD